MGKKSRLKKESRTASEPTKKMSEMVMEFAADYINMGDTLEQKQSYLNGACVAWNIANLDPHDRPAALNEFLRQYQERNPGVDDVENLRHDMELLIQGKLKLFPRVRRGIVNAELKVKDGKEVLFVTSTSLPSK